MFSPLSLAVTHSCGRIETKGRINQANNQYATRSFGPYMVVDVHAVEPFRRNRRMYDRGISVSAEADPAYLAGSPVLLEHIKTAPFSQSPIEPLHGVDAMHR